MVTYSLQTMKKELKNVSKTEKSEILLLTMLGCTLFKTTLQLGKTMQIARVELG